MRRRGVGLVGAVQGEVAHFDSLVIIPFATKSNRNDTVNGKKRLKEAPVVVITEKPVESVKEIKENQFERSSRNEGEMEEIIPLFQKHGMS